MSPVLQDQVVQPLERRRGEDHGLRGLANCTVDEELLHEALVPLENRVVSRGEGISTSVFF